MVFLLDCKCRHVNLKIQSCNIYTTWLFHIFHYAMKKVHTLSTVDLLLADIKFPMNSPQPFTVAKMLSKMQCICLKLANNLRLADSILKLRHFITHYFQPFSACWLIIYGILSVA